MYPTKYLFGYCRKLSHKINIEVYLFFNFFLFL